MKKYNVALLFLTITAVLALGSAHYAAADEAAATVKKSPTDNETEAKVLFDFEEDTEKWSNFWKSLYIVSVETSDEQALKGSHSLKVSFDNTTDEKQVVSLVLNKPPSLEGAKNITFHYWLPTDSPVKVLQPSLQSSNFPYSGKYTDDLVKGEWGKAVLRLEGDPGDVTNVHIQIWLPPQTKGSIYFDSITW